MTTSTGEHDHWTLGIDGARLLKEFPAFFAAGAPGALSEMIQNAYRAGATQILFHWDAATHHLIIEDDGKGTATPEALFTAGMTGWDTKAVVDPAGLGFFSFLGLASTVHVTSWSTTHWEALLDAAAWEGAEIPVTVWPPEGKGKERRHGMRFDALIKPAWHDTLEELSRAIRHGELPVSELVHREATAPSSLLTTPWPPWANAVTQFRQAFPLTVYWETTRRWLVEGPSIRWVPEPHGEIPGVPGRIGRLGSNRFTSALSILWEHRLIPITDRLRELVWHSGPRGSIVWDTMQDVIWEAPASLGLRPRLPDRTIFLETEALEKALDLFQKGFANFLNLEEQRSELLKEVPRRVRGALRPGPNSEDHQFQWVSPAFAKRESPPLWPLSRESCLSLMDVFSLGYPTGEVDWEYDDEIWIPSWKEAAPLVLDPIAVSSALIAWNLRLNGFPAVQSDTAPLTHVGLHPRTPDSPQVWDYEAGAVLCHWDYEIHVVVGRDTYTLATWWQTEEAEKNQEWAEEPLTPTHYYTRATVSEWIEDDLGESDGFLPGVLMRGESFSSALWTWHGEESDRDDPPSTEAIWEAAKTAVRRQFLPSEQEKLDREEKRRGMERHRAMWRAIVGEWSTLGLPDPLRDALIEWIAQIPENRET